MREGSIAVNDARIRVRQDAAPCRFDLTAETTQFGADGGDGSVAVAASGGCSWTASASDGWILITSAREGTGNGSVSFHVAPNTGAPRTGTTIGPESVTIAQGDPGCTATIQPAAASVAAAGGSGTVTVATLRPECTWTATSLVPWITIASGVSGSGNGSVVFTVAANTGPARAGTIGIAGVTFTVSQEGAAGGTCSVSISPATHSVPATGASGLGIAVSAAAGCTWTATSAASWIAITAGATGTGNGSVSFDVSANPGSARSGTLNVGSQAVTVTQAAGCTYAIEPTSQSVAAAGGTGTVGVSTAGGCAWTAGSNAASLTIVSGTSGNGTGSVGFSVAANAGNARTGTLTIAGQVFTVNQAGGTCSYSIDPTSQTIGGAGGPGTPVAVSAPAGCGWTASRNVGWLTITSGASGTGDGTVTFDVSSFGGNSRTGTLTIANQTFTVTQVRCSYAIAPASQSFGVLGGSGTVNVTTAAGCGWTATSNANWITVTSGTPGTGNGTVTFLVSPNLIGARTGTLTIGGETITVTQSAVLGSEDAAVGAEPQ